MEHNLMWTLQGKRTELFASISNHKTETRVRIMTKPSRQLLLRLLEQTAVKELHISSGLWKTVPLKVREALDNVGVKIVVLDLRAGRPARYEASKKEKALVLLKQKKTAKEISEALGLPTTTVYYYKLSLRRKARKKLK